MQSASDPQARGPNDKETYFVGRMRHSVRASPALSKCWSPSGQNRIIRSPDFGAPVCSPVCPRNSPNSLAVSPSEGLPGNTVCVYLVTAMLSYEGRLRRPKGESNVGPSRIKKRSIVVNGHKTSISLEDEFWNELRDLAAERRVPVTALVNEIDQVPGRNLSSAIRVHLFMQAQQRRSKAA